MKGLGNGKEVSAGSCNDLPRPPPVYCPYDGLDGVKVIIVILQIFMSDKFVQLARMLVYLVVFSIVGTEIEAEKL
ncbi:hypothetical protein ACFFUT_12470 [Pseudohalocynthiibacter aestuariivivens]|uniref:Uncharacterized protein n=1 Tax=Pseudohalocynthiibacter aestuariivivens TaxID=1591409 RepID=A0ABV5JGK7_9RHOB|nr:hypothetical protein [Pseudohalocynthiibacter aestuariivivens]MBS9718963.1 hypothetical protein [Pseudohalocynthiibacter aestuariivivens]